MRRFPSQLLPLLLAGACTTEAPLATPAARTLAGAAVLARGWSVSEQVLGTLGGSGSFATAINNAGTVVGWSYTATGEVHAFRWSPTTGMQDLGTLPGHASSQATAIADDGRIVGVSSLLDGPYVPVLWTSDAGPSPLPIPLPDGATFNYPADINASGQVVGFNDVAFNHGWLWSRAAGWLDITATIPGGFETFPNAVNASGLVVGGNNDCSVGCTYRAFLWSRKAGYRDLGLAPGASSYPVVAALGVNNRGVIVGWHGMIGDSDLFAYLWTDATRYRLLPRLPSPYEYAYGTSVNAGGTAVGASLNGAFDRIQAVAWPASGGIVPLFPGDDASGVAVGITDNGLIAGWRETPAGTRATLWRLRETPGATIRLPAPRAGLEAGSPPADEPSCLRDIRALSSRRALAECLRQ